MAHLKIEDNGGDVFDDVVNQTHQFFIATGNYPTSIEINDYQRQRALADRRNLCTMGELGLTTLCGFPVIVRHGL